jgi:hypothetical protein
LAPENAPPLHRIGGFERAANIRRAWACWVRFVSPIAAVPSHVST